MKKFDTLISTYLYTNKKMEIEGLGSFWVDDSFVLPPDTEKTAFYPLEGIHFTYSTRAETTPELLNYLVQQTGKIRSLIAADFSSYVEEIKQFVNIGKPWVIEGIGTLQKNKLGNFELVPGEALSERINMHYVDEPDTAEKPVKRNRWILGLLFTVAVAAVVAGLGFGVYVLFIKTQGNNSNDKIAAANQPAPQTDTNTIAIKDSVTKRPDSLSRKPDSTVIKTTKDSVYNYKIIHEVTKWRDRAEKRTAQLLQFGIKSHFDSAVIRDTLRYRLFIYQKIFPADTNRVKDSLSLYFGRRVRLVRI